ncbi:PepSY domain-containing protein [Bradyrhizobium sp. ISRA443]|uniref:PepSY domain-containing protein n=1 Tax=unclassified Bradyrhizobium TaxID=2631580 RepID=UPI0024784D4A|nr:MULTISPECIES: PepSY domain-containing protein [unclassified Bradyrhizobium]WGS02520.1 PepSY domain-containing protein [Bradyrhizobium sp. ISRA436]WGS09405.1 PepSY domain-containing protein [Bradyrhizobium sp. ISRA437]WGS16294.1 PepSY domain-containing protein [Bradyrhizobium sp. ISRA443]
MTTGRLRRLVRRVLGTRLLAIALLSLPFASPAHAIATMDAAAAAPFQSDDSAQLDAQAVRREIDSFRAAQVSLRQAMAIAEAQHAGSTTADVSFDGGAEPAVYRVKTLQRDRVWQHAINAATGEVMGGEAASPLAMLDDEDRSNLVVLRGLRHRLSDAVRVAEHATSGKAISGGMTRERGRLNFVIVVVSGADLKEVILEPPGARRR